MRTLLKGLLLGIGVIILQKICCIGAYNGMTALVTVVAFALLQMAILPSKNVVQLFCTGLVGLFVMFFLEISYLLHNSFNLTAVFGLPDDVDLFNCWFDTYVFGLIGSAIGVVLSLFMTLLDKKLFSFIKRKESIEMDKAMKAKLLIYAVISAVSFSYLVLPQDAGVSVLGFVLLQAVMLWFVAPDRKRLVWLIPISILALNSFISGNVIWRIWNVIVSFVLYAVMFADLSIKDTSMSFLRKIGNKLLIPVEQIPVPFEWIAESNEENTALMKRIAKALLITIPVVIILLVMLSNADMIFGSGLDHMFEELWGIINANGIFKCLVGFTVGLYLFGAVYSARCPEELEERPAKERKADLLIVNVLLVSILAVYTIFVVIQFRYLFAGGKLPYGLTYTEYARKGFFELLWLTMANLGVILACVWLTKNVKNNWAKATSGLCQYLCLVTVVLLCSSFYRMWLYSSDDGLTRLRFMVFGFLIFEAIGLIATFFYIAKPRFNIVAVYLSLGLVYYLLLNLVPMDRIIAQNQIDIYKAGKREDIIYVLTLSPDAAQPLDELADAPDTDEAVKKQIEAFFKQQIKEAEEIPSRWQRYNLSVEKMKALGKE